jgi:bacitracin transport system permease protein
MLLSIIGMASAPFLCFMASLTKKAKRPDIPLPFKEFVSESHLYIFMLIAVFLFGIITAYLFNREYVEGALKNLLTIPISRISLIVSKWVLLFFWIMTLTVVAWVLTMIFGIVGPFEGLSNSEVMKALKEYMIGGILLFLLTTPIILITLIFNNYVTIIVFTIVITMLNLLSYGSEYSALFPWSAVRVIAAHSYFPEFPPVYSYISIFLTSMLGLVATLVYFKKVDIR